jgi:hypothetical protein
VNVKFGLVLYSLLPSRGKSVNQCWWEMAASPTERSWYFLEILAFRRQFGRRGPPEASIRRWYEQFRYSVYICHQVLQNTPIIYTHPVYIYIYMYVCMCVCVCIKGSRWGVQSEHLCNTKMDTASGYLVSMDYALNLFYLKFILNSWIV